MSNPQLEGSFQVDVPRKGTKVVGLGVRQHLLSLLCTALQLTFRRLLFFFVEYFAICSGSFNVSIF